jgi:metal-sulfur cluster biosynthetic enzyme
MTDTLPDSALVWRTLESIPDPEFGINIVDLGLIYSVECTADDVKVVMTLTTPTCPSAGWIHEGVQTALRQMPGVKNVHVDLVFEPPWNTDMLSANARRQLGWNSQV